MFPLYYIGRREVVTSLYDMKMVVLEALVGDKSIVRRVKCYDNTWVLKPN